MSRGVLDDRNGRVGRSEIKSLTAMRGVAALVVVLYHLRVMWEDVPFEPDAYTGLFAQGFLWVDFFFVLSGFVLTLAHGRDFGEARLADLVRGYGRFLRKRLARIYPLHVFVLMLFVLAEVGRTVAWDFDGSTFRGDTSPFALATNLLLVQAWHVHDTLSWNWPAWSISAEWGAYLAFPAMLYALRRPPAWLAALYAPAAVLCLVLFVAYYPRATLDTHHDYGVFRCLAGFGLGILTCRAYRAAPGTKLGRALGSDASCLLALGSILASMHLDLHHVLPVPLFCWLILGLALNERAPNERGAAGRARPGRASRLLAGPVPYFLGAISYSVYLVQWLWMRLARDLAPALLGPSPDAVERWTVNLLVVAAIVTTACLTHRYVELPGQRLLRPRRPSGVSRHDLERLPLRVDGPRPGLTG